MSDGDRWAALRRLTPARIGIGRSGISQSTTAHLVFQLAHAQARDAVHRPFDAAATVAAIESLGLATRRVRSAAPDRVTYLQRPDLGRRLAADVVMQSEPGADLAIVVADGLSALAVERHAVPFIAALQPLLIGWRWTQVVVVEQGRVAIGDDIGQRLGAACVLVLIGERPGLSSPDSLGLYITWAPRVGRSDAERNCISNVRPEGLPIAEAARRCAWLLQAAKARGHSGVALKDDSVADAPALPTGRNFLIR